MVTVPIPPLYWQGRKVSHARVEDDCFRILRFIAQAQGETVEHQLVRIIREGMLPCFGDAIRLYPQSQDENVD
jgi:hypothetical protein